MAVSVVFLALVMAALIVCTTGQPTWSSDACTTGQQCPCCNQQLTAAEKPVYQDCEDVKNHGHTTSGIYQIQPKKILEKTESFNVYCDMETDSGGWLVFQRRMDGSFDFYRPWESYKNGFGHLKGEMWLGNDKLFWITSQKSYQLRIDMRDDRNQSRYALYESFFITDKYERYKLHIGNYSGDAGDSLTSHNMKPFSTFDKDNPHICARSYKGAWWYQDCHSSNLNGRYLNGKHTSYADGINWYHFRGYHNSLVFTEMKIKPS